MTKITDLRSSLEAFSKADTKAMKDARYADLSSKLKAVEMDFESAEKEAVIYKEHLDKLLAKEAILERENRSLAAQVAALSGENASLESRISVLKKSRPVLSSSGLVKSFASSLAEMDKGLNKVPSGPKYIVSSMNVTLKAHIALEKEEICFQLPGADDIISPDNLSTIEFSLRASSEKPIIDAFTEVPGLAGLSKEEAERKLSASGLKVGNVLEINSGKPPGMVLAQLPSEGSLAEPGAEVDLTVSGLLSVKVPDLTGLGIDDANMVLEKSGLRPGRVTKQSSDKKSGIVLTQTPKAWLEAEAGSAVDLVVSEEKTAEIPEGPVRPVPPRPIPQITVKEAPSEKPSSSAKETISRKESSPVKSTIFEKQASSGLSRETSAGASGGTSGQDNKSPDVTGMPPEKTDALSESRIVKSGTIFKAASAVAAGTVINPNPEADSAAGESVTADPAASKKAPETKLRRITRTP